MLLRSALALVVLGAAAAGAGLRPAPTPAAATAPTPDGAAATFTIDRAHSTLVYRLRHFGVSNFYGRVNLPTGSFRIDDEDLAGSFVNVVAEIRNMDTGNDGRDRFLASPDFFNAREHPTAEFRSTAIRRVAPGAYEIAGEFTMHGVTRPVTVRLADHTTLRTERFGLRGGFECTFTVRRSDFGMDLFVEEGTLGDEVTIIASIEGVVQEESD